MCVFDDGYPEYCSFPLVLYYGRFLGDNHIVDVIVVDVYGQVLRRSFDFRIEQRKSNKTRLQRHLFKVMTSLSSVLPSAPLNFTVTEVTSTSIEVSWSPPTSNGSMNDYNNHDGNFFLFSVIGSDIISYFVSLEGEFPGSIAEVGADVQSIVFSDLTEATTYT